MDKRRVLLLSPPSLLGDGVTRILLQSKNVELIGPWSARDWTAARHDTARPQAVVVAEPIGATDDEIAVTSQILEQYANVPVVRICTEDSEMRVHTMRYVAADVASLVQVLDGVSVDFRTGGEQH